MLCSVIAYYTAKGLEGQSLYSESLKKKEAEAPPDAVPAGTVRELMKTAPPVIPPTAHFAEIAQMFLSVRVNNLYVVDAEGKFLGAVSLHDIKPYLGDLDLTELVIASDILRDDFARIGPEQSLSDALGQFLGHNAERLPVVDPVTGSLLGSLAKNDLLLALVERRKKIAGK
jgi:CIC family chloride channel protein